MSHRLVRSALCVALVAAFAQPVTAATRAPAYTLRVSPGTVQIEPTLHAPAWQLRVSAPDGKIGEDTLLDGEPMLIQPKLFGRARFVEGSYTFQLVPVLGDRQRGGAASAQAPSGKRDPDVTSHGTFRVEGGKIFIAGATEPVGPKPTPIKPPPGMVGPLDQVIPDDLIVQGSLCTGFDCVNNESFGFDTIRLKENNLRINFADTSTSAGYPTNDWRIIANDSASGGNNYLGFEDSTAGRMIFTVEAGAPLNALYVDSTGNIGLSQSAPGLDLHMTTTDTPAVRMEQTSAGGFTAQTWDIGANEANFFVRDLTGGSLLSLRIRPGAPTSSIDISADGDVGMGTGSPEAPLHIENSIANSSMVRLGRGQGTPAVVTWDLSNDSEGKFVITDDATNSRWPFWIARNAVNDLVAVGATNASTVDINGNLRVTGKLQMYGPVGPDYVFADDYALPTIAAHAEQMRSNRHLPKVGPAQVNAQGEGVLDLYQVSHGMLEELEVAHLYIAELDGTVRELRDELGARDEELAKLRAEVEAIKQALQAD